MIEKQQRTVRLPKNHFHEGFSNTGRLIPKGSVGWANVTSVTVFLEFLGGIRSFDAVSRKGALFPTLRSPPRLIASTFMVFILSFFPLLLFILFYKSFCCLYLELQPASCLHSVVCQCHNLAIALDLPKNNYCSVHPFSSKRLRLESIFSLTLVQETVEIPDWQPGLLLYNAAPRSVVSSDIIVMYIQDDISAPMCR